MREEESICKMERIAKKSVGRGGRELGESSTEGKNDT